MISILRSSVHRGWILLMIATLTTYNLRFENLFGYWTAVATIGIALFKARLVVLDFMELRNAGRLRIAFEALLYVISVAIVGIYYFG